MGRMVPYLLVALVVITVYALWLRATRRPAPVFDLDAREVRGHATVVAGEADDLIDAAGEDVTFRRLQLGEHAVHELERAVGAAARGRNDILELLDLIGQGRQDLDDVLHRSTDRTELALVEVRRLRRHLDEQGRELVSVPGRIENAERLLRDLRRTWEIERDRAARLADARGTTVGRRPVPRSDLAHADRLIGVALEACTDARGHDVAGDARAAVAQVQAAEALADEVAALLDGSGGTPPLLDG